MMEPSACTPAAAHQAVAFEASVPKGLQPGRTFTATSPDGQAVQVVVPEGAAPGDVVPVEYVPVARAGGAEKAPPPTVIGVPVSQFDAAEELEAARGHDSVEERAVEIGLAMYGLGWCVCCFLGPFGPIFWICTWLMHRCRPREERKNFPHERAIARLSCCTGLSALAVHCVVLVAVLIYVRRSFAACGSLYENAQCMQTPAPGLMPGAQLVTFCLADCGPARCYDSEVFGGASGVYAEGSAICGAALQAGAVEEGVGGYVAVLITEGQWSYSSTRANGVTSGSATGVGQGFMVVGVQVEDMGNNTSNTTLSPASSFHNRTAGQPTSTSTLLPTSTTSSTPTDATSTTTSPEAA